LTSIAGREAIAIAADGSLNVRAAAQYALQPPAAGARAERVSVTGTLPM